MCPTFCMKVRNGCYVCDCGMFSNYLHRASNNMAAESKRQPAQTGSQLSSFTSGYATSNVQNAQRIQDYSSMMRYGFHMNVPPQPLDNQHIGLSAPDFTNYGYSYQNMPGMNCVPVEDRCPSSCWSTDVFTGCVYCVCAHLFNRPNGKQEETIKETSSQRIPTTPVQHHRWFSEYSQRTPTPISRINPTLTSRTNGTYKWYPTLNLLPHAIGDKILVPTKPPTTPVLVGVLTLSSIRPPTTLASAVPIRLTLKSTGKNTTPPSAGYRIPTPLPKINNSLQFSTPQQWNLSAIYFQIKQNYTPESTFRVRNTTLHTAGYLSPTSLSNTDPSLHVSIPQQSRLNVTENEIDHLSQIKLPGSTRVQYPGNLTTSGIIDTLRGFPVNDSMEMRQPIKQSTTSSKLEQPFKPQIMTMTTGYQTMKNSTNSSLMYPLLSGTGNYSSGISEKSNALGFYGHSESG